MPARRFDRARVRAVRRAAELSQGDIAAAVGVGTSSVAGWEADSPTAPDPEKLPALSLALGHDLDELFPREGPPDLADLRCDAGLYQYETAGITGTKSAGPVRGAERGERRLKDRYVPPLAKAYGVSTEVFLAAQERSFGREVPEQTAVPVTLAEKIAYLLEHTYPGDQQPPTDAEMARAANAQAGADVVSEQDIQDLRTGKQTDPPSFVLEGLAKLFDVSKMFFDSDADVVRQVVEGIQLLTSVKSGALGKVAARGIGDAGLDPDVMAFIRQVAQELQEKPTHPAQRRPEAPR